MIQGYIWGVVQSLIEEEKTNDPFKIAKNKGMSFIEVPDFKKQKGFYKEILNVPFIFLDKKLSNNEARVVCAHELGHYILHENLLKVKKFLMNSSAIDVDDQGEMESNLFAAELLISDEDVLDMIEECDDMQLIANHFRVDVELLKYKLNSMQKRGVLHMECDITPSARFLAS